MDSLQGKVASLTVASPGHESYIGHVPAKVVRCSNIIQGEDGINENCPEDGTQSCAGCYLVKVSY